MLLPTGTAKPDIGIKTQLLPGMMAAVVFFSLYHL
jgi:hypothetical protein